MSHVTAPIAAGIPVAPLPQGRQRGTTVLVGAAVLGSVTLGVLALGAAPALAAYPPDAPVCSVATSTNTANAPVTLTGVGFLAGGTVTVSGTGVALTPVRTVVAGADGSVRVVEKLGGSPGTGQYSLSGTTTNSRCGVLSVSVKAVVIPPAPKPKVQPAQVKGKLAFTGAEGVGILSVVGVGLVGAGAGAVVLGRRRRTA